ncbi:putative acetylxylan esterase A [Beauveria bassiana]|nr:putative acetylxylan esterase A [Beauveria bassiana]
MHFSTLLSFAAAGALVASMPYKEANQVVDNLGSGMSSDDTKGPEDWRKEENLLYKLLIEYRKEVNVQNPKIAQDPEIARSPTLDKVARTHIDNPYFETGSTCNPHSWTATADKEAKWKSCCFNIGQANTWPCMWDKPREISGGQFQGNGYEVYHGGNPNVYTAPMTAKGCLNAFKNSTGHNPVLINNGTWSTMKWESVGCGMGKGQCAIWFSPEKDSAASPDSQTAQDGLETPVSQKEEDALETPPKNPNPSSNPTPTPTPTSTPNADATPDNESGVAKIWTQCGGKNWTGPTVCAEGLVCKSFGVWYSQCKPAA